MEENSNKKSTFCILPWIHAQTKPNGQIKPCCRFDHKHPQYKQEDGKFKFDKFNVNENVSFTDALMSKEWEEIRQAMQNSEKVPGCRKCYQEESQQEKLEIKKFKIKSMRGKENWLWNSNNQQTIDNIETNKVGNIRYLELALGTYCNLKCRTCTADLSSSWVSDEAKLSKYYKDRRIYDSNLSLSEEWNEKDFLHIEEIKFTGGEPMLHPKFIKLMDILISTGRSKLITLDIFTNASWVPKSKVLDRLNKFKKVIINLSVDGVGEVNDYIREPSDWKTVESSVIEWINAEIKNPETYLIKWVPCVSIYNVWQFTDMMDWWFDLQYRIKNKNWWESIITKQSNQENEIYQLTMILNVVYDPKYLALSNYPDKDALSAKLIDHKLKIISKIKKESNNLDDSTALFHLEGIYNKLLAALNTKLDINLLKTFIEYTADLDKLRGKDIRKNLPYLWNKIEHLVEYKGRISE